MEDYKIHRIVVTPIIGTFNKKGKPRNIVFTRQGVYEQNKTPPREKRFSNARNLFKWAFKTALVRCDESWMMEVVTDKGTFITSHNVINAKLDWE